VIRILPGDCWITSDPSEMLSTTLGSCVSACIRDVHTGFGGMNHFMLPSKRSNSSWGGEDGCLRYGDFAMDFLLNAILETGCKKSDLEIKVFGGGNVIKNASAVGTENAAFILNYLDRRGLKAEACDLGGPYPRRIHYFPASGRVERLLLKRSADIGVLDEEARLLRKCLDPQPVPLKLQNKGAG
jgi:chemotaxis protein CheD